MNYKRRRGVEYYVGFFCELAQGKIKWNMEKKSKKFPSSSSSSSSSPPQLPSIILSHKIQYNILYTSGKYTVLFPFKLPYTPSSLFFFARKKGRR